MKMKSKNGISLMALIATVAVVLILITTITVSFEFVYTQTKEKDFANEIYSIQKLVDIYHFKNNKYPVVSEDEDIVVDLSKMNNNDKTQFSKEEVVMENSMIILKRIDLYEADVNECKNGHGTVDDKNIYCVSENTGIVYYLKGKNFGDNVYYTLTEELKTRLGI